MPVTAPKDKVLIAEDANRFPPEVFEPHDDVTPEAVALLRERTKDDLAGRKWKHIGGREFTNAR